MNIYEFYKKKKISVRSYNICRYNNLNTLLDLTEYYIKHKTFTNLRNCGKETSSELIDLCNNYSQSILGKDNSLNMLLKKESFFNDIISNLSTTQKELVNSFIILNIRNQSVRTRNAILSDQNYKIDIDSFSKVFFSDKFRAEQMKNIGLRSIPEVKNLIYSVENFLVSIKDISEEKKLKLLQNNFHIQKIFSLIDTVPDEIISSIFRLVDYLIQKNALYNRVKTTALIKTLKIYSDTKITPLDEIARQIGLSRERIRQIRSFCFDSLLENLSFLKDFDEDLLGKYKIDATSDIIKISDDSVEFVNKGNERSFTKEFIIYILSAYLFEEYIIVGNVEDVLALKFVKSRKRHNWRDYYLVKRELTSKINFIKLANNLRDLLNKKIEQDHYIDFKKHLVKFTIIEKTVIEEKMISISKQIILNEFNPFISFDSDNNLIIKKNTKEGVHEYIYSALKAIDKPTRLDNIIKKISELEPKYETTKAKVRYAIKNDKRFISLGRNSIFGLEQWKHKMQDYRVYTIRERVEEFLKSSDKPEHISDITNYIISYKPSTNKNSVLQNLRLDKSGKYLFFNDGKIGISSKEYDKKFVLSSQKKVTAELWKENFEELLSFVQKENRLPSFSADKEEQRINQWLFYQKKHIQNKTLDSKKEEKIEGILNNYKTLRKTKIQAKYKQLSEFVKRELRVPLSGIKDEKQLYQFFHRQKKLFEMDKLDEKEKSMLIEIIRSVKK